LVGLRAESGEELAPEWEMRAKQLIYESDTMTIPASASKEMYADAQVWKQAAIELRRKMEAATVRQPKTVRCDKCKRRLPNPLLG
jgi:hypothetical protein